MTGVSRTPWGSHGGQDVSLYVLQGGGLRLTVSNYGALLQSLVLEDAPGGLKDLVLGYDSLREYVDGGYFFGASIGPVADRMAGGTCRLDGRTVQLPRNAGPDSMHSGPGGFHSRLWDAEILEDGVAFSGVFPEEGDGFPGTLTARLAYRLLPDRALRLEYAASCTREMAFSFTNHSYFNLSGARTDCRRHTLCLNADFYAETQGETDPLATGRFLGVAGTPLDFREGAGVGDAVSRSEHPEIRSAGGVDHYFSVRGAGFREMARLTSPADGLGLSCWSDAEGLQVYTGNFIAPGSRGKGGAAYGPYFGVCLETGQLPNAVNFPSHRARVVKEAGEVYRAATEYRLERL